LHRQAVLFAVCSVSALHATVIAGTSITQPLPYNQFNTFAQIANRNTPTTNNAWMGVAFAAPTGSDPAIGAFIAPLRGSGTSSAIFRLYGDNSGKPGPLLETATASGISASPSFGLVTVNFSGVTQLTGGATYYVVGYLPVVAGDQQVDWAGSNPGTSVREVYGTTGSGGAWNTLTFPSGPAFQVLGTDVPEPQTSALIALTLGGLLIRRRLWLT
jgi:hypothetical protein